MNICIQSICLKYKDTLLILIINESSTFVKKKCNYRQFSSTDNKKYVYRLLMHNNFSFYSFWCFSVVQND